MELAGRMKRTVVSGAALLLLVLSTLSCASDRAEQIAELAHRAISEHRLPSLSVSVGVGDSIIYSEAFGQSDLENAVPATRRTVYRFGSVSKAMTAVAVLRLAEEGKLDLSAPIQEYCPSFPEKSRPVTSRLLLAHLAGIRHYKYPERRDEYLSKRYFRSIAGALSVFKEDPLIDGAERQFVYSSFGYVLLGCVIEGASGRSYREYMQEAIFLPAGMKQTALERPERLVPHRARGYDETEAGELRNAAFVDLSDRYPSGGLIGTAEDLVSFGLTLLAGKLLSDASREEMWTSKRTGSGEETGYGFGWNLSADGREVTHGGLSAGASSYLYILPAEKVVVGFCANLQGWGEPRYELAQEIARVVLRE
jgi:CubicO group peptidase (beta-lactamase class C family)